jgi:hypothetical protein
VGRAGSEFFPMASSHEDESVARAIAEGAARAKEYARTAVPCQRCGKPVAFRGRTLHYSCDPAEQMAGKVCTCAAGCTNTHYGNGPTPCDERCVPCRLRRGQPVPKKAR